ncbi:YpoC family protein [Thalassobacillus hwangdonensis]|uniref:YpoC family protein n=1 Tax=Thalassobacillus hwangdonensis TaxID=546108 RepID=A0ABW3KY15_9BACI
MGEALNKELAMLLKKTEENDRIIASLFQERKLNQTKTPMKIQINYFYKCLYLLNSQKNERHNVIRLSLLPIAPKNVEERVAFIEAKPGHYYSYKQLSQLFTELNDLMEQERPDGRV